MTVKTINGKKVHILPRGTKIYYKNYSSIYEAIDTHMQQWDKRNREITGNYGITQGGSYLDENAIKLIYGIDVNAPDKYLYISMNINGNPNKYAPNICCFRFK